jgi:VanZ family protein
MHYSNWCQKYQYDPLNIHENKFADYILEVGGSLTVATIISLASYPKIKQRYIVLFLIVFSLSMEVFQLSIQGRFFEFLDLGANVMGILLALLFAQKIIRH